MHEIVHIEFSVKYPEKAANFFTQLFSWECRPSTGSDRYWEWKHPTDENTSGGIGGTPQTEIPTSATTLVYVSVANIAQTIEKAKELGGFLITPETKISDAHGYFAIITEPSGCQVGIWSKTPSRP